MSLRSFTVLALSLRKRADIDLRPVRIHSTFRSRSFAFHAVTQEQAALTWSAGRQRCGRLPGTVHPLPAGLCRMKGATERTTLACRLRIRRIPVQTPSDGCFRRAPSLPDSPMSHSATRSVLIPRPAATARLCFCCAALRVSAFRKSFCQRQERKNIFRTFRKRRRLALGAGHTRVASLEECPE
jgi:hypothetical protein